MAEQLDQRHSGLATFGNRPFLTEVEQLDSWLPTCSTTSSQTCHGCSVEVRCSLSTAPITASGANYSLRHGKSIAAYERIAEEETLREMVTWPDGMEFGSLDDPGRDRR